MASNKVKLGWDNYATQAVGDTTTSIRENDNSRTWDKVCELPPIGKFPLGFWRVGLLEGFLAHRWDIWHTRS
jgi:hypothetical protein